MYYHYSSKFIVLFIGFENKQQQQLESLVKQHAAYLNVNGVNIEGNMNDGAVVCFVNYTEEAFKEAISIKGARIVCSGKFQNFEQILNLIQQGVYGCISSTALFSDIIPALEAALQIKVYISPSFNTVIHEYFQNNTKKSCRHCLFTEQEHILVQHLTAGALYKEIAAELNISENTVRSHVRNIYSKLKVHSKTELAQKILRGNLITTLTCFIPDFIACLCY